MKHLFFLLSLFFVTITLHSQTIRYAYDNAGNRVERTIHLTKSSPELRSDETALTDVVSEHILKIYPNPTKGQFSVEVENFSSDTVGEAGLYDIAGKTVHRQTLTSGLIRFDLGNNPTGIYILKIKINDKTTTWKIIKE
jgi:YD repeat-containing protein